MLSMGGVFMLKPQRSPARHRFRSLILKKRRLPENFPVAFFIVTEVFLEQFRRHANICSAYVSAPVAQWIEHLPSKQRAAGSSPAGGTTLVSNLVVVFRPRSRVPLISGTLSSDIEVIIVQRGVEK